MLSEAAGQGTPSFPPWVYFIGGLGTFIAAIAGAIGLLRKLGPQVSNIQITSAQHLVTMAEQNAKMSNDQALRLQEQNKILDDRLTEYAIKLGEATARIEALEDTAREVAALRREVERERAARKHAAQEKERIAQENERLKKRVDDLEAELHALRDARS